MALTPTAAEAKAMGAANLTLPEPPSANRWWRNVNGRMVTSKAARDYKAAVELYCVTERVRKIRAPIPVRVFVWWHRARKSGDLDKRLGVLLDALQGLAYDNDSQIVSLHAERYDCKANPRIEVRLEA